MCVCVCVCVYVCMHACVCVCVHAFSYVRMYVTYVFMYERIYVCTHSLTHVWMFVRKYICWYVREGADKSFSPTRKEISYSDQTRDLFSILPTKLNTLLSLLLSLLQANKKNPEFCPSNQDSAAAMNSASNEKWLHFNCFFSPGNSPTGPDPENCVGDQDTGSPGRPVSSGLQVSGEPGHCRTRTRPPWWSSRGIFPSKCPSIAPAEISNTPRW